MPAGLPSLENLRCFLAAADHLNFRRAARAVALTPTAFSQRIRQLEEQVGRDLFERTTRRVTLTSEGAALVRVAREAVLAARRCIEVVHQGGSVPAKFMLGTRFELGLSWIVPAVVALRELRPEWTVDLYFGAGDDIVSRLLGGDLDCIVTSAPLARVGFRALVLHPEDYALVGAPPLLAVRPFERPQDARAHTLLDLDRGLPLARYLVDAPGGTQLSFGDVRLCGSGASIRAFILAGLGVGVLPIYMVREELASGALVRLLPEAPLMADTFRLIYAADSPLAPVFEDLAGVLRDRPLT